MMIDTETAPLKEVIYHPHLDMYEVRFFNNSSVTVNEKHFIEKYKERADVMEKIFKVNGE
jgi:hypothetical protein